MTPTYIERDGIWHIVDRTAASTHWEPLAWDSTFFGFPVARIRPETTEQELPSALSSLREARVELAYWILPSVDKSRGSAALAAHGTHIDDKTTFVASVDKVLAATSAGTASIRETSGPAEPLLPLALAAGVSSRFRLDPNLERWHFERMYAVWLERSLRREIAAAVYVTGDDASPTGFVTVGPKGDRADIGLIAVDSRARRQGLGTALVRRSARWAHEAGLSTLQVVTQGVNIEACALYERCGLRRETVCPVFHFWPQRRR